MSPYRLAAGYGRAANERFLSPAGLGPTCSCVHSDCVVLELAGASPVIIFVVSALGVIRQLR